MLCRTPVACLDFLQLEADLPPKGPDDQGDDEHVQDEEKGFFDAPRHLITSDGGADLNVHVPGRP